MDRERDRGALRKQCTRAYILCQRQIMGTLYFLFLVPPNFYRGGGAAEGAVAASSPAKIRTLPSNDARNG